MITLARSSIVGSLATIVALATAPFAQAQTLRIRVIDEETRQPLAGGLVSSLETNGAIGAAALASGEGIATVRAASAGPHRLLIRHIGFAPVTTDPVDVPPQPGQIVDIVVRAHRITLGAVRVVGNATCPAQAPSPSESAVQAWTEVRTALEASTLTRDQRLVATSAVRFQRDVRIDGLIYHADTTQRDRAGERPFFAPEPAALERDGYFKHHDDGTENFYAPDEAILLSPGFTRRHCLTMYPEARHDANGTQIALAFMPRDRDTRPEIKGLIWIDSATSELRRIEFEYVRISLRAPADSLGGSVDFRHLASGAWIVSSWVLRMPRFRQVDRRTGYDVLDSYIEVGGSASVTRDMAAPAMSAPRVITGVVYDSLAMRPLTGARVHLTDAGRESVSDSLGRFRFDSVSAGEHQLWIDHPILDALGLFSLAARVDAAPQLVNAATFALPSFATFWRRACGSAPEPGTGDGLIFGTVRSGSTAQSIHTAAIDISWPATTADNPAAARRNVRAQTDSIGDYVLCGIPNQQVVTLSPASSGATSVPVSFRIGDERVARRDFTFLANAAIDSMEGDTLRVAAFQARDGATLSGVLRDSAGRPVRDARIAISGVQGDLRSDATGAFIQRGVPPGAHVVAINASGYLSERRMVNFAAQDSGYIALALAGGTASGKAFTLKVVAADGAPIAYANVSVAGGATQITDKAGEVALGAGRIDILNATVRRIGFAPWYGRMEFPDTSTVLTVMLTPAAQQLGAVRVTGQKNPISPFVQGFYDRWMERQKGALSAVFIGPEELESRHPDMITNMLRGLNGFCLVSMAMEPSKVVIFSSRPGSLQASQGCPNCPAAIVIDGMQQYAPAGDHVYIDRLLTAHEVMGIEVYARGGNMPISLQVNDTKCGVVAFWTGSRR